MKKQLIKCLVISISLLSLLSCKKDDKKDGTPRPAGALPATADTIGMDNNVRITSDSIIGNYIHANNPTPNVHNEFFIRCIKNTPPTPLIITFHGGFFTGGNKQEFRLPLTIGGSYPVLLTALNLDDNKFAYAGANYRLLGNVNDPSDDNLTVKDCMADCKAFVEYMRDHATEYNIDPNKIILMGYSGGASTSLWLGLQSNFITGITIKGIVTLNTQSTLNILEWQNVFETTNYASDYNTWIGKEGSVENQATITYIAKSAKLYYGTIDPIAANKYCNDNKLSFFKLIDSADPELFMATNAPATDVFHHTAHDMKLLQSSIAAGHKAKIMFAANPYYVNPNFESVINFFIRKFK